MDLAAGIHDVRWPLGTGALRRLKAVKGDEGCGGQGRRRSAGAYRITHAVSPEVDIRTVSHMWSRRNAQVCSRDASVGDSRQSSRFRILETASRSSCREAGRSSAADRMAWRIIRRMAVGRDGVSPVSGSGLAAAHASMTDHVPNDGLQVRPGTQEQPGDFLDRQRRRGNEFPGVQLVRRCRTRRFVLVGYVGQWSPRRPVGSEARW